MAGLRTRLTLAVLLLWPLAASADPPPEEIPAPRPVPEVAPGPAVALPPRPILPLSSEFWPPAPLLPPVQPEFGRRSVWQFYGVTRRGQFRPLVVETPYGAYYRYNGAPFPWIGIRTDHYMPYVVD